MADIGRCCVCQSTTTILMNIVMLPLVGTIPGRGWGCVTCGLPYDGAVALVCPECMGKEPVYACRGFPDQEGRDPIADLVTPHTHDVLKHLNLPGQRAAHSITAPLGDAEFVRVATVRFLDQRISRVEETMRRYGTHITALEDGRERIGEAALEQSASTIPSDFQTEQASEPTTEGQE